MGVGLCPRLELELQPLPHLVREDALEGPRMCLIPLSEPNKAHVQQESFSSHTTDVPEGLWLRGSSDGGAMVGSPDAGPEQAVALVRALLEELRDDDLQMALEEGRANGAELEPVAGSKPQLLVHVPTRCIAQEPFKVGRELLQDGFLASVAPALQFSTPGCEHGRSARLHGGGCPRRELDEAVRGDVLQQSSALRFSSTGGPVGLAGLSVAFAQDTVCFLFGRFLL